MENKTLSNRDGDFMLFKAKRKSGDTFIVDIQSTKNPQIGDALENTMSFSSVKNKLGVNKMLIKKIIENRDCRGVFKDQSKKKNSFYKLETELIQEEVSNGK